MSTKKFAIVKIYGLQYQVSEGDTFKASKIDAVEGTELPFQDVLATSDAGEFKVGAPFVQGASVTAKVVSHGRHDKILVFKYLRKNENKKMRGHKQPFTTLTITNIHV